ncbi:MAG: hypothetical protein HQ472_05580 [Ignavibacteria bacterium]|nr:hypothetical protein [Ignavibacteria bacterium]
MNMLVTKQQHGIRRRDTTGSRGKLLNCYVTILTAFCTQFGISNLSAQDPVSFDGSRSKEMQVAWTRTAPTSGFGAYVQNVADIPGNNVVRVRVNGEVRTWPTTPLLDTTANVVEWIGGIAYDIAAPFDYDGIPPMELFSGKTIFRPSIDGKVMTAIDTVDCFGDNPSFTPYRYLVDVDGDGLQDIVGMANNGSGFWFSALLNGPGRIGGTNQLCPKFVFFFRTSTKIVHNQSESQPRYV